MRQILFSLALIILVSASALAQPEISVVPASFELGTIGQRIVDTTLVITNRGNQTLVLERASASCGCTAARFGRNTLEPGDTTSVAVTLDGRGKSGDVRTSVTIHSNDARS